MFRIVIVINVSGSIVLKNRPLKLLLYCIHTAHDRGFRIVRQASFEIK
jgi:hypothetical protein